MIYLKLFIEFFKTGLFAIGGGLVTIPFLAKMGENFSWFSKEELVNMIAVSESTPGPIGINMATYVGYKVAGAPGSIIATVSEVLPALIIIIAIAGALHKYRNAPIVDNAFKYLRPTVFGLIISAYLTIFTVSVINKDKFLQSNNIKDLFDIRLLLIFIGVFLLNKKWKIHPIFYVILSAILGIVLGL